LLVFEDGKVETGAIVTERIVNVQQVTSGDEVMFSDRQTSGLPRLLSAVSGCLCSVQWLARLACFRCQLRLSAAAAAAGGLEHWRVQRVAVQC